MPWKKKRLKSTCEVDLFRLSFLLTVEQLELDVFEESPLSESSFSSQRLTLATFRAGHILFPPLKGSERTLCPFGNLPSCSIMSLFSSSFKLWSSLSFFDTIFLVRFCLVAFSLCDVLPLSWANISSMLDLLVTPFVKPWTDDFLAVTQVSSGNLSLILPADRNILFEKKSSCDKSLSFNVGWEDLKNSDWHKHLWKMS